ncbi:hypothetical protein R9C00_27190 [Flammeovirgaceae bacterium SG7u.111]|nr:hypothetical protein [Flammeovirgaceae bacterium SG7u.132]WPO35387.1 hypothetical protein R9C00_27190 [Flammeovirgaceae bacterium SG7u.111]
MTFKQSRTCLFFLILLLPSLLLAKGPEAEISLYDAVDRKLIKLDIEGKGGYNGECILLKVTNVSNYRLNLKVEPGTMFQSDEDWWQNLVVTQEALLAAGPKRISQFGLFTMCTQSHNAAPSKGSGFSLGKKAEGPLLALAQTISENEYQSSTAQSAVWAVTSEGHMGNIYGRNPEMVKQLCEIVSEATGKPCDQNNYEPREHHITTINTSFECLLLDYAKGVKLRLYDQNGQMVREYLKDKDMKPGFYQFKVGMHHTFGDSATFTMRLENESGVLNEKTVTPADSIVRLKKLPKETFVTFELPEATTARIGIYDSEDKLYILLADDRKFQKGFNRAAFMDGRELPIDREYFLKIKKEGKTIVEQKFHVNAADAKKYKPMVKRGQFRVTIKKAIMKGKLVIYDANGQVIWVVFEDSKLYPGKKGYNYMFQHTQGPDAKFTLRLLNDWGQVVEEQEVTAR